MRAPFRSSPTPRSFIALTIASCTAGAVLIWSPGAFAAAGCTTTTPSLGQTIVCTSAGTDTIIIPSGANYATVIVIGGGGGSGASTTQASGAGGNGAQVSADLEVDAVTTFVIDVGQGGVKGTGKGGDGGSYSRVRLDGSTVIVAGGGGGGGEGANGSGGSAGAGGSGGAAGSPAGGAGTVGPGSGFFTGGGGGNSDGTGTGGTVGSGGYGSLTPGRTWSLGGDGGPANAYAGGGGNGYGGGGSGGSDGVAASGGSGGGAGGSFALSSRTSNVVYSSVIASPGDATAGAGAAGVINVNGNDGRSGSITITFFFRAVPTTSSQSVTPRIVSLDFTLPSDMTCAFDSAEGSLGSWIQLPEASDCTITPRAGGETPTLLGWATQENFPVAIAQRQVDNGWGAYETFNDEGRLTGVFIPAGGYTTVSHDTTLFPIWSL